MGFGEKFYCLVDFLRFLYKTWVVFGGVLRIAAGMCSKIANLLEKNKELGWKFLEFVDKKD